MGTFKEIIIEKNTGDANLSFEGLENLSHPTTELRQPEMIEKDIFTLDIFGGSSDGDAQFFKFWSA